MYHRGNGSATPRGVTGSHALGLAFRRSSRFGGGSRRLRVSQGEASVRDSVRGAEPSRGE